MAHFPFNPSLPSAISITRFPVRNSVLNQQDNGQFITHYKYYFPDIIAYYS